MKISFFAKLGMMLIALFGVIYFMKSLDSGAISKELTNPDNSLSLLLGSDEKVNNWCPSQTVAVEIYNDEGALIKTVNTAVDISSLCEVLVGSFNNDGIDEKSYLKRLVAKDKTGAAKVLEQIPGKDIFRVQGLPFRSSMLLKNIANRANP